MKIAIVTGASSGMGREMAIQIGDRFSGIEEIWVIARRGDRLASLCGQVPARIRCFAADVTDPADIAKIGEALESENPTVKIFVHAAGFGVMGPIGGTQVEKELDMVRLNCEAMCAMTHMVLPYMGRNSRIILFASAAAFLPQPGFGIYAASKAFVLSYSRALGAELKGRQILVTAVCPGPVKTEFLDIAIGEDRLPFYKKLVMADPRKVVKVALRDSAAGRDVSVYGIWMKMFCAVAKILPHPLILRCLAPSLDEVGRNLQVGEGGLP